jgi:hypothetical protein
MNATSKFTEGITYEGCGAYGYSYLTVLSRTEKTILAETRLGKKRLKIQNFKNGQESVSWGAWTSSSNDVFNGGN